MNPLPPLPRDQRKIDAHHLKLHFVGVGLAHVGCDIMHQGNGLTGYC